MTSNKYAVWKLILNTPTLVHRTYWKVSGHACSRILFGRRSNCRPADGQATLTGDHQRGPWASKLKTTQLKRGNIEPRNQKAKKIIAGDVSIS